MNPTSVSLLERLNVARPEASDGNRLQEAVPRTNSLIPLPERAPVVPQGGAHREGFSSPLAPSPWGVMHRLHDVAGE
jgi:hypothetical protein